MKSSIKIILTAAVLLTATIFSFAQRGDRKDHDPAKKAEMQTTRMVENLSLNDKQAAEVKAINMSYAEKMKDAYVANKDKGKEAMKAVRADLEEGRSGELAKVLTTEQFQTYEAKKSEIKGKRKGGKKGDGHASVEERAEKNTTRMVENLSLNQTQAASIKAINLDYAKKMKALHDANKGEDREAMKTAKDDLNASKSAEFAKVLTPEQFKTYQEMKAKKMGKKKGGKKKARS